MFYNRVMENLKVPIVYSCGDEVSHYVPMKKVMLQMK